MKRFVLILISVFLAGGLLAQEQGVSTFKSPTQRLNTESLFPEAVTAPKIEWRMGTPEDLNLTDANLQAKAYIRSSKAMSAVRLYLNNTLVPGSRGLKTQPENKTFDQPFSQVVTLAEGENKLKLVAVNPGGETSATIVVYYTKPAPMEKRLALVIGNAEYPGANKLANPGNDAQDMAAALKKIGFDVMLYTNLASRDMKKAVDEFGVKLRDNYQVGLFYYAGHGVQARGRNYLVPTDAKPTTENEIDYDCVLADRILTKMEDARTQTNIVVLDACRNNPFERSFSRGGQDGGLASMNAPTGSLIAYATAPGRTAEDGTTRNGLYTAALLKAMQIPNLTIEQVFKQVRSEVTKMSSNKQQPWENTSMIGDFYFIRK